jgi:hypothetical protein
MKTRYLSKKLILNKKTIAHLSIGELMKIKGGECETIPDASCYKPIPTSPEACMTTMHINCTQISYCYCPE